MKGNASRNRLGLIIPWVLLALVFAGWTGYWFVLRTKTIDYVNASIAAQNAAGAKASYESVKASGYPLRLTLHFSNASYEAAGAGWALAAPNLDLHINPSNLDLIILEPHGAVTWRDRDIVRTLQPRVAAVSVRTAKGAFAELRANAQDLAVSRVDGPPATIGNFMIGVRPDPRVATDMQASIDVTDLALAAPPQGFDGFGREIKTISARIVVEKADLLQHAPTDRVEAWRQAGGALRVESTGLLWGPATLTGAGRISLDAQHRPDGRLNMTLATKGATPEMNPLMQGVFAAAAQDAAAQGAPTPLPLVFENGVMKLGEIPLRPMDPIK